MLRLNISGGRGHYLALSYWWGGPQTFATTASTLADKIAGCNIDELCQTALTHLGIPNSGLAIFRYFGNPLHRHPSYISALDNAYPAWTSYIQL
jgi:hypothetical protein